MRDWYRLARLVPVVVMLAVLVVLTPVHAQETQPTGTDASATTPQEPAGETKTPLMATVIEVAGGVDYAPVDADPLDATAWKPVTTDMKLGADTQIRTGLRSHCTLLFGEKPDQTVISVRRATLACIADVYRSKTEQRIRIGLGYGAVRGGSTEGTLRSDVVIDSPVATLAKRGTEGFEMEVAPVGDFFRVSLARSGLVTALSRTQDMRRTVRPGQYVSQRTIARTWVNQESFDRTVRFFDVGSMSAADTQFTTRAATGLGSVAPGGGRDLRDLAARDTSVRRRPGLPPLHNMTTVLFRPMTTQRPEGNFGFGRRLRVMAPLTDAHRLGRRFRAHPPAGVHRSAATHRTRRR